jgi:molybdenum cofactor synthesis domain-containing protein
MNEPSHSGQAVVITASTRAAGGAYADRSGPILVAGLRGLGFAVAEATVVADGQPVAQALQRAIASGVQLVLTTGGTGLGPTDQTSQLTAELLERPIPGIAEALRAQGIAAGVPAAMLSTGVAGLVGHTLVINVAGSPGACRDALEVLQSVLTHAVAQIHGGDHPQEAT